MENDNPVFSRRVSAGTRVYFIDVNKDSKGQSYMALSEIPTDKSPGNKKRQRVFIHEKNIVEFAKAFGEAAEFIRNETEG